MATADQEMMITFFCNPYLRCDGCVNWTSTTGCTHGSEERAQHSNLLTFEGNRK